MRAIPTRRGLHLALAASLIVLAALVVPALASATPKWKIEEPPLGTTNGGALGRLNAVSCWTYADCMAVGQRIGGGAGNKGELLVETFHENLITFAHEWTTAILPLPTGAPAGSWGALTGVTCPGGGFCYATGWYYKAGETASPHWFEASYSPIFPIGWTTRDLGVSPEGKGVAPSAIGCENEICWIVGGGKYASELNLKTGASAFQTTGELAGAPVTPLTGITCVEHECKASGSASGKAVIDTHASGKWVAKEAPLASGSTSETLAGIACHNSKFANCMAAGASSPSGLPVAVLLNGESASAEFPPLSAEGSGYVARGVTCTLMTCLIGGNVTVAGAKRSFADRWTGTSWVSEVLPTNSEITRQEVNGVRCSAREIEEILYCMAVGTFTRKSGIELPFAERYQP